MLTADGRHYRISYAGGDGSDVTLTVVNAAPAISAIAPQSVPENTPLDAVAFTVGDSDDDIGARRHRDVVESWRSWSMQNLAISSGSGSGTSRSIAIVPNITARGDTTITLTVSDGADSAIDNVRVVGDDECVLSGGGRDGQRSSTRTSCSRIPTRRRRP